MANLSIDQEKEILNGYVNYELNYFKNALNINLKGLKREWKLINSKLFILWHFEMLNQNNADVPSSGQIYLSTVCFNQVLAINIPLVGKKDSLSITLPFATALAENLKTFNEKYVAK